MASQQPICVGVTAAPLINRLKEVTNTRDLRGEVGRKLLSAPWYEGKLWTIFQQPAEDEDIFYIDILSLM